MTPVKWSAWWVHQLATVKPSADGVVADQICNALAGLVLLASA